MHQPSHSPAAIYVVLASTLTLGCEDSRIPPQLTRPNTGTLEVWVSTAGRAIDLDADALRVATIDRPSDLESKVYFALAKSEQLPFSKETFDIAVLAWSL